MIRRGALKAGFGTAILWVAVGLGLSALAGCQTTRQGAHAVGREDPSAVMKVSFTSAETDPDRLRQMDPPEVVELIEDFDANRFPMPTDVTGRDPVAIGRLRQDISDPHALELWLCGDQIRKGAALNAIQIAELLFDPARQPHGGMAETTAATPFRVQSLAGGAG